jgi:hypothetical protein
MQTSMATTIYYDVTNITGNTWEYSYTVNNDTLSFNIDEFTIYFSLGDYQNLSVVSSPVSWDSLVVEPDNFLGNDGYFDSLALSGGIAPGNSLGGLIVSFNYLGTGNPGSQLFEIVDPADFTVLDSGQTEVVPVPSAILLFGSGLLGLVVVARRKSNSQ